MTGAMPIKVLLFTGSRDCDDYATVQRATALAIESLVDSRKINLSGKPRDPFMEIVCRHGAARGADDLFVEAVNVMSRSMLAMGVKLTLQSYPYIGSLGKAGGPMRNKQMVEADPKPDLCIAVKKRGAANKGTSSCIKLAEQANITVVEYWS